jgi:hypothetical protein
MAPAEVKLRDTILRTKISMREEEQYIIKLFIAEDLEPGEFDRRLRIYFPGDAMQKSTFCFWVAEILTRRMDFSNHNFTNPLRWSSI